MSAERPEAIRQANARLRSGIPYPTLLLGVLIMILDRILACCLAGIVLATTTTYGHAADAPTVSRESQETTDEALVKAAEASFTEEGFVGLQQHASALREVLDHAPKEYPAYFKSGSMITFRTNDGNVPPDIIGRALGTADQRKQTTVALTYNVYPTAALYLGSLSIEAHRPDLALSFLDRGLALQPGHPDLTSEKAQALYGLKRFGEALSLVDAWLTANPLASDETQARMLRSRGFALTELGRLDEAEATYKQSLKLQPDHPLALRELKYIRGLRSGCPKESAQSMTADKAATQPGPQPSCQPS